MIKAILFDLDGTIIDTNELILTSFDYVLNNYLGLNIGREEILESFREPGIEWIEANSERNQVYSKIVKNGNRKETSKVVSTLMRKKKKIEAEGRKFHEQDNRLLTHTQSILFTELAFKLDTTFQVINRKITKLVNENDYSI